MGTLAHSFINILSLAALTLPMAELSGCDRKYIAHKAKTFTIWPLTKTFASSWSMCLHVGCSTSGLPSSSYPIEKNHLGSVLLAGSPIHCVPTAWHRPLNILYWSVMPRSVLGSAVWQLWKCQVFRTYTMLGLVLPSFYWVVFFKRWLYIFWLLILCWLHVLQTSFPSLLLIFLISLSSFVKKFWILIVKFISLFLFQDFEVILYIIFLNLYWFGFDLDRIDSCVVWCEVGLSFIFPPYV